MKYRVSLLTIVILLTIQFVSCKKESNDNLIRNFTKSSSSNFSDLTGQDIFKGIFFLNGNFCQQVDVLKTSQDLLNNNINASILSSYSVMQDDILSHISSEDANFFNTFKSSMCSGDPIQIRTALFIASNAFNRAIFSDPKYFNLFYSASKFNEKLDMSRILNTNGSINQDTFAYLLNNTTDYYQKSQEVLDNFGMMQTNINVGNTQNARILINFAVAVNIGYLVNVVSGVNFGVNTNNGLNINNWINVNNWINTSNSGSGSGGGTAGQGGGKGGSCPCCPIVNVSGHIVEESKKFNNSTSEFQVPPAFGRNNPICDNRAPSTDNDIFIAQLTSIFYKN